MVRRYARVNCSKDDEYGHCPRCFFRANPDPFQPLVRFCSLNLEISNPNIHSGVEKQDSSRNFKEGFASLEEEVGFVTVRNQPRFSLKQGGSSMIFEWIGRYRLRKFIKQGLQIADDCRLVSMPDFGSECFLISIGKHVTIASNVTFITHDGGSWVFREQPKYKEVIKYGRI